MMYEHYLLTGFLLYKQVFCAWQDIKRWVLYGEFLVWVIALWNLKKPRYIKVNKNLAEEYVVVNKRQLIIWLTVV